MGLQLSNAYAIKHFWRADWATRAGVIGALQCNREFRAEYELGQMYS
jgi:hypothetical protein